MGSFPAEDAQKTQTLLKVYIVSEGTNFIKLDNEKSKSSQLNKAIVHLF